MRYARFHDRMAVLVGSDSYDEWLDPSRRRDQLELLRNSAYHKDGELEYFPISTLVNNPSYDGPDCVEPASAEELASLARRAEREKAQMDLGI